MRSRYIPPGWSRRRAPGARPRTKPSSPAAASPLRASRSTSWFQPASTLAEMHDLRWIRDNPEEFDRGLVRRGLPPRATEVLAIDKEWRALQTAAEEAQATRNRLSREVGAAKKRGEPADALLAEIARSKDAESETAAKAAELRRQLDELLATLPNLPAD